MNNNLTDIFEAKSIAVVGASEDSAKAGYYIYKQLLENFNGKVYGINPRLRELFSQPCYPSLDEIKESIDLLVTVVPAKATLSVMEGAAKRGDIKGAIILSAGYSETGTPEGIEIERRITEIARKANIRIIGPNCVGIVNTENGINTVFGPGIKLIPGKVGYITQSGAFGNALLMFAGEQASPMGFAKLAHIGNMSDISNLDVLEFYRNDPKVSVIAMYLEGIRNGREFFQIAAKTAEKKPLLVFKVGRTDLGAKAAMSHTGSLAGTDKIYDSVLKQSGAVRLSSIEEMVDGVKAVANYPRVQGGRVAILTECGGPGIICTDEVSEAKMLELASINKDIREELTKLLPPMAMVCKPDGYVDMTPAVSSAQQAEALGLILSDPNVDMCVLIGLPTLFQNTVEIAQEIVKTQKQYGKPVAACFMRGEFVDAGKTYFEENGIMTYDTPEQAVKALDILARASLAKAHPLENRAPIKRDRVIEQAIKQKRNLLEPEAMEFLKENGIGIMPNRIVTSKEEVRAVVQEWGKPIVLKVVSPQVIHKSDVGGVKVNICDTEQAEKAYDHILSNIAKHVPEADIHGMLAVPMAKAGTEVIVGVVQDAQFGPTVMFGLGGIFVEVFKDVSFRIAPFDREVALEMINETNASEILRGVRGEQQKDVEALVQLLVRVSELAVDHPDIKEIDLNPVRVYEKGLDILDARIMLNVQK
ncbi:MAG: acetate--CoA ligase family protein [Dehalobacterium sp.]